MFVCVCVCVCVCVREFVSRSMHVCTICLILIYVTHRSQDLDPAALTACFTCRGYTSRGEDDRKNGDKTPSGYGGQSCPTGRF